MLRSGLYLYHIPSSVFVLDILHLHLLPTPARNAPEEVAKALQWLRGLPAPPDVAIGPVGGGLARHALFKDHTAPLPFSSKDEQGVSRLLYFPMNRHPLTVTSTRLSSGFRGTADQRYQFR